MKRKKKEKEKFEKKKKEELGRNKEQKKERKKEKQRKMVWFSLVLWHINHCKLFNAKFILYIRTVLFTTIQFSINTQFECQKQFYFKLFSLLTYVK